MKTRENSEKLNQAMQDINDEIDYKFQQRKRNRTQTMELIIHGIFLLIGLITVGCAAVYRLSGDLRHSCHS